MDERLRQLARAARNAGRDSPEDVAFIAGQVQAGLPVNYVNASADLGDLAAIDFLSPGVRLEDIWTWHSKPWFNILYGRRPKDLLISLEERSVPSTDEFESTIVKLITKNQLALDVIVTWLSDAIKRYLTLAWQSETGRGHYLFRLPTNLQKETVEILSYIEKWTRRQLTAMQLFNMTQEFCSKYEPVTIGFESEISNASLAATCFLLQSIICTEFPCGPTVRSPDQAPFLFVDRDDYIAMTSEELMMTSLLTVDASAHRIFQRAPHTMTEVPLFGTRGKKRAQHMNALRRAFRKEILQNLADILLNRTWNRPTLVMRQTEETPPGW